MMLEPEVCAPYKNSAEVRKYPHIVQQLVDAEVEKGHILGPFDVLPLPNLIYSLINIVPKTRSPDKFQLMHDLLFPHDRMNAINDCIPEVNAKVQYHHINKVINLALAMGLTMCRAQVDIKHTFQNLPMHPNNIQFLSFMLNGKIYLNSLLPFGTDSSCTS